MSEWREVNLDEIVKFQRGHDLTVANIKDGNYPVAGSNGVIGYHNQFTTKAPGITLGRSGNSIGIAHYYDRNFWAHNTTLYTTEFISSWPKYVYYFLRNTDLSVLNSGSAIPSLNRNHLNRIRIKVPDLPEQKAIASVLSSLDDKIDLLHRQNKTLEAMAETLFRQWFVEEAQDDWNEAKLADVCSVITKGTTPTTFGYQFIEKGINFIKAESITDSGDFILDKFAQISEETHQFLKRSIIESGDVLCSIAGTIGRIAIVDDSILPANTNQAIAILRVDYKKCLPEFVYLFLKSTAFREIMDGKVVHAVQPNLSLGEIGNTIFLSPPKDLMHKFELTIRPIFEKKKNNSRQIHTLETLRDTLLPKLMSGEVQVDYP